MRTPSYFMLLLLVLAAPAHADELVEEGFADSGEVKIHCVTAGKGPLVVLLHGPTGILEVHQKLAVLLRR